MAFAKYEKTLNEGTGAGLVFDAEDANRQNYLKSIKAGTGILVTNAATDITIGYGGTAVPTINKVIARSNTARSMANGTTTVMRFEIEDQDTGGEYDPTTGIYTAGASGYRYAVASLQSASVSWSAGKEWSIFIDRNNLFSLGNTICFSTRTDAAITKRQSSFVSGIFSLAAGDTLRVKIFHDQGGAVNTDVDASYNFQCYFHIYSFV